MPNLHKFIDMMKVKYCYLSEVLFINLTLKALNRENIGSGLAANTSFLQSHLNSCLLLLGVRPQKLRFSLSL